MKSRKWIILVALLLALGLVRVLQQRSYESSLQSASMEMLAAGLSLDESSRLEIVGPESSALVLARKDADWFVESSYGHPVQAGKLESIFSELLSLQGEFRSSSEEVLTDYQLKDEEALHLKVFARDGGEALHLLIGSSLPGGSGFFLRRAGEINVYASHGRLLGQLGLWGDKREPEDRGFLDLSVLSLDAGSIEGVLLVDGDSELRLSKEYSVPKEGEVLDLDAFTWKLGSAEADRGKVESLTSALAALRASGVLDPSGDHGFSRRVEVSLPGGETQVILFGKALDSGEGTPVKLEGKDAVFRVYAGMEDRLFKGREEFLK